MGAWHHTPDRQTCHQPRLRAGQRTLGHRAHDLLAARQSPPRPLYDRREDIHEAFLTLGCDSSATDTYNTHYARSSKTLVHGLQPACSRGASNKPTPLKCFLTIFQCTPDLRIPVGHYRILIRLHLNLRFHPLRLHLSSILICVLLKIYVKLTVPFRHLTTHL